MVCKTLDEFEKRWREKCEKIQKSELDFDQAKYLAEGFSDEVLYFWAYCKNGETRNVLPHVMKELFNDLDLSLQIAISNYKKRHGTTFIEKVFGVKHVNLDFNAVKNQINQ